MNEIIKKIENATHIVVIAHIHPDADSLSSASAMYTYLLQLHKKVSFFCVTKDINKKYAFLPWFDKIRSSFPSSSDLAIAFDCGSYSRLGCTPVCDLINIDHHKSNENYGCLSLVDTDAVSTTKVLFDFFKMNNIKINPKMATALYAGLLDDSNGLLAENVKSCDMNMAQELRILKADYKTCNTVIMKQQTLAGLRIKAIMLQNMKLLDNGKIALFLVSQENMQETGALGEDCEAALEEALYLVTVQVSILLKENKNLSIKGSLRSRNKVNILKTANYFNGGGHSYRAGFILSNESNLEEASYKVTEQIKKEIQLGKK